MQSHGAFDMKAWLKLKFCYICIKKEWTMLFMCFENFKIAVRICVWEKGAELVRSILTCAT
jgi:hypothetical protein